MVYVLFKRLPNLRLATRSTLWQNPNFCSKNQVLNTSIFGGKIQIQFIVDFIKIEFLVQKLRFCISVIQQKPDDVSLKQQQHTFWKCYFVFFYTCNYTLKTALKLQVMSQSLQECVALRSFVPTHVIRGKMEWRTASTTKAWNEARRVEHNSSSYPRQSIISALLKTFPAGQSLIDC